RAKSAPQSLSQWNNVRVVSLVLDIPLLQPLRDHVHVLPGLLKRDTRLRPREDVQPMRVAKLVEWRDLARHEYLPRPGRWFETLRQDTDNSERPIRERNGSPHRV